MLKELYIKNLAVISETRLQFSQGFQVITGETGAGKSVLFSAIQALLGQRINRNQVRDGAEEAVVEGFFAFPDRSLPELSLLLNETGFTFEENGLIISRIISRKGENKCYLNNRRVTLALLKNIGDLLVDIHGQNEHQTLLKPALQARYYDFFIGIQMHKAKMHTLWNQHQQITQKITAIETEKLHRQEKQELYKYQLKEIRELQLLPQEDQLLSDELSSLENAEKIKEICQKMNFHIDNDELSLLSQVRKLQQDAHVLLKLSHSKIPLDEFLDGAIANLQELQHAVETIFEHTEIDHENLANMRERYSEISSLCIKYNKNVDEIMAYADHLETELALLDEMDLSTQKLVKERHNIENQMLETARQIREKRLEKAADFALLVEQYLQKLNMQHAHFEVAFNPYKTGLQVADTYLSPQGSEQVEFLISTMLGAAPQSLRQIASGGEISRIMLALKSVLRDHVPVPILIFDEIDAGIGGQTAEAVGRVLAELVQNCQLFCVTHQPSLAAYAQSHFKVDKNIINNATVTTINEVQADQRVQEISRMLDGNIHAEESRKHAQALLEKSQNH